MYQSSLFDLAQANKIGSLRLPAHPTHLLQSLNVRVFSFLKQS